jgi:hypothetical protein
VTSFFSSFACRCGGHCTWCRDRQKGADFRATTAKLYGLPSADFDCPHNHPWGYVATSLNTLPPTPAPTGASVLADAHLTAREAADPARVAEAKRRFEICKTCDRSTSFHSCTLYQGCCFGRYRTEPQSRCPLDKWAKEKPCPKET